MWMGRVWRQTWSSHVWVRTRDDRVRSWIVDHNIAGLPPNRGSVERLVPVDRVDETGRVRVDSCLRVEGTTNIFAVGDCCDTQGGIRLARESLGGD